MTLALLLTAVSGAWAQTETLLTTITATAKGSYSETNPGVVTVTHDNDDSFAEYGWLWLFQAGSITVEAKEGYTITKCVFSQPYDKTPVTVSTAPFKVNFIYNDEKGIYLCEGTDPDEGMNGVASIEVYGYASPAADPAIEVTPGSSANTWTFSMPGSDVVLTPLYAPTAKWDVVENVEQLPAALEGIIAGQDAAIVTPGQSAQGTPMYAVTPTAEAAPALTAFSATVPTAKTYDDATTLYVWYYIKGQDTPQGQEPTAENTFNDSEISATPLKVDILTNKFDLTLSPAPVKNMTVTVAGQAKTPTDEGKVEAVKMQSEVKLKAATGYKFRKVEVKKKAAEKTIKIGEQNYTVLDGETWKQFISRNQLSTWGVDLMTLSTWYVYMDEPYSKLHVSSDGTNWTQLVLSSQDAPIDTDKQYKWVQEDIGGGGAPF